MKPIWSLVAIGWSATAVTAALSAPAPETAAPQPAARASTEGAEFFEKRVRPLLAERCFACHGEKIQQGGLRLDSRAAILKGTETGHVVLTPGNPEKSALIQVLHYTGAVKMPPAGKLAPAEIETLTRWVRMGAPWPAPSKQEADGSKQSGDADATWAFKPVRLPAVPAVKLRAWVKSPIDAFILAGLEKRGLTPARWADRRTLIRRATFDLTGLPPTPAEVEAFVNDRSPDAWAKVVDRLLASPRFGERWARHWLDVARYCDSFDARLLSPTAPPSEMDVADAWRYRDWVVRAFNTDMPYDQFLTNQIAGDLLPAPTAGGLNRDGIIATGFLALGNWGGGDADKEKLLTDIADDQVDTVSRAFMGLTVGCARCHDHKFDPISTKDYYGLAGIFFSTHILANVGPKTNGPPMLRIPLVSPAEQAERQARAERMAALEKRLSETRAARYAALAAELQPEAAKYMLAAWDSRAGAQPLEQYAQGHGLRAYALRQWRGFLGVDPDHLLTTAVRDVKGVRGVHSWRGAADCPNALINTTDQPVSILTFKVPPHGVTVHPGPRSGVILAWMSPISGTVSVTGKVTDADPNGGDGIAWVVRRRGAGSPEELATGDIPNGGEQAFSAGKNADRLSRIAVRQGEELQLVVLPKADYVCDTTLVQLRIAAADGSKLWDVSKDLTVDPLAGNPHPDGYGNAAVWRFADAGENSPGTSDARLAAWSRAAAGGDRAALESAAAELAKLIPASDPKNPFRIQNSADETELSAPAREEIMAVARELDGVRAVKEPPLEYANGAQDGGVPGSPQAGVHDVKVHIRGRYDRLGDPVPRHFPVVLAGEQQPSITQGSGRLDLARWLARRDNPLTARVIVNRIWQHLFGQGIVRTPSNFGKLGERPTHPELLDWLATDFIAGGAPNAQRPTPNAHPWSVKKLIRQIMLSAAYQQSSVPAAEALRKDPDNRLFGRMNRKRLEAEAIRDNLLAVTGRLGSEMGGVATPDFGSPRRSLYLRAVRSDRSGFGPLFDVADSTASVDRRSESTVAPQALFMWNGPFALESAGALAKRLLDESADGDSERITRAYKMLYGRPATADEVKIGEQFLAASRGTDGAKADLRAWKEYAAVLLCANEFIYVD